MDFLRVVAAPSDERGFIHKRGSFFRRVAKKLVSSVPVVGGVVEALGTQVGVFEGPPSDLRVHRQVPQKGSGCPPGFAIDIRGQCVEKRALARRRSIFAQERGTGRAAVRLQDETIQATLPSGEVAGIPLSFGEAKMGRFGAGLEPAIRDVMTRICPRGAVLAVDGLCYNRRDIRNSERAWPRGRRPLLTGGEMRCISVASSAAKKLQRKQKQLEQLGLLKRPSRARRALPAGHVAKVVHAGSEH